VSRCSCLIVGPGLGRDPLMIASAGAAVMAAVKQVPPPCHCAHPAGVVVTCSEATSCALA
jgi:hypothetical protein